jgi:hypothetical protein
MDTTNFHLQRITRSGHQSAAQEYRYICCEREYSAHLRERLHIEHVQLPAWTAGEAHRFWEAADTYERQNAWLATMLTAALPRALTLEESQALVREYFEFVFADTKVLTWGIHAPIASDGQSQPHLHALYSLRTLDGIERSPEHFFKQYNSKVPEIGGAQKDLWYESDNALYQMRKVWDFGVYHALARAEPAIPAPQNLPEPSYELTGPHRLPAYQLPPMLTDEDIGQGLQYRERSMEWEWSL